MNLHDRLTITVAEFCRITGIGRTKFYSEVREGHILTVKCGRRTLVPVDEVKRWFRRLEEAAATARKKKRPLPAPKTKSTGNLSTT